MFISTSLLFIFYVVCQRNYFLICSFTPTNSKKAKIKNHD
nr:MAG TPA: hypothetical protein [Caudoviricetes sp.]